MQALLYGDRDITYTMIETTEVDNDNAVRCTECEWLGYAANASQTGSELVCPKCEAELEVA